MWMNSDVSLHVCYMQYLQLRITQIFTFELSIDVAEVCKLLIEFVIDPS
jgi:hypothetical protein